MRIVLDSNVLISAFATRGLCADLFRDVVNSHQLLLSDYIVDEVAEKLANKLKVKPPVVDGIKILLRRFVHQQPDVAALRISIRDPDDIPVVTFAVAMKADLLISGDRDLLEADLEDIIRVVAPRGFYEGV